MNAPSVRRCPACGDPLVLLDGDVTRRCRWCGYVAVCDMPPGEGPLGAAIDDGPCRPAREGGRDVR